MYFFLSIFTFVAFLFADQSNITLNILIEKELPISLLQLYKINIEYILAHINKLLKDTTTTSIPNSNSGAVLNQKIPVFVLKNLLSFSQYKHLRKYHELSHAVATNSLKKRKEILKKILPGELTIMAYYLGGSPYLPEDDLDEDMNLPCETITFVPLIPDPLLSIVSGIDTLLKTLSFPSIFKLTPTNTSSYTSLFNEQLLVLPKNIEIKETMLNMLNECICHFDQCTIKDVKNVHRDDESELMVNTGLSNDVHNGHNEFFSYGTNQQSNPLNTPINNEVTNELQTNLNTPQLSALSNKLDSFVQSTLKKNDPPFFQQLNKQPLLRSKKNYKKLSPFSQPIRMKTFDEMLKEKRNKKG